MIHPSLSEARQKHLARTANRLLKVLSEESISLLEFRALAATIIQITERQMSEKLGLQFPGKVVAPEPETVM